MSTAPIQHGAILTIDMLCETDYCQVVIPMVCGVSGGSPSNSERMCYNLVQAFKGQLTDFLAQLSEKAYVTGIGAEAMLNGYVPYRENYVQTTTYQGTRGGATDVEPSAIGVVVDFYYSASDVSVGDRTAVSHNTIPGIPEGDTGGNVIVDALKDLWQAFWDALVETGWAYDDSGDGGDNLIWKRANKAPSDRTDGAQAVRVAVRAVVKRIVGSVRRRLAPPRR